MRLIDSISLKNAVNAYANEPVKLNDRRWGIKCKAIIADMIGIIEEAPTVDAAPVVHGEWIGEHGEHVPLTDGSTENSCSCSICGRWLVGSDEYPTFGYYCPNCGAKMDEERIENGNHH